MTLDELEKKVDVLIDAHKEKEEALKGKDKKRVFKGFGKAQRQAKKAIKEGKFLVCYLRNNRSIDFFWTPVIMGLIDVDPKYRPIKVTPYHGFEPGAVYSFKNKWPVLVIPEWRLLPVGGVVEDLERSVAFGGDEDKENAAVLKVHTTAEVVLANMMERKEMDATQKPKGSYGWLIWVGIAIVAGYIILKLVGVIK